MVATELTTKQETATALYLDLMKRCLVNWMYADDEYRPLSPHSFSGKVVASMCRRRGIQLVRKAPFDALKRSDGRDRPTTGHTMIGLRRLDNLQFCMEDVIANRVPGDFIETGVWRGGATIFMRAVLKAHQVTNRFVWVADSFAGLPAPNPGAYAHDAGDQHHLDRGLAVSLEAVQANFEKYGLLDEHVRFLKGWFRDTLPNAPFERLAVMRLDGDMYESTMDALVHLYPKLSSGGFVIIDDYGAVAGCRQAVNDFRQSHDIRAPMHSVDWTGVYWQKT